MKRRLFLLMFVCGSVMSMESGGDFEAQKQERLRSLVSEIKSLQLLFHSSHINVDVHGRAFGSATGAITWRSYGDDYQKAYARLLAMADVTLTEVEQFTFEQIVEQAIKLCNRFS